MTERPVALTVLPENIPAELKALPIWVCWRYEWSEKRQAWGKVPYTPFTTKRGASNRPSSWRSFQAAYNCYVERRDFFDGVFACLSDSDPYAGGDFDHDTNTARIPHTYAELSPSGKGVRFIGRGSIPRACKKPSGELYDRLRFLSITGHRLPNFPCEILPIQPALDALYEELQPVTTLREGHAGAGNRAANAAAHTPEEWEEARQERRQNISQLLGELRARSVNNKTGRRDTMLAFILRKDYKGFHEKWPHVGIVKSDGVIDPSQIRAVMANSIKGRGFTFPQFVALMSFFYGAECSSKWGTKQAVQEEFATLWAISRTPRTGEHKRVIAPVKRGKGSDHATLVERAYQALEDFKAGIQALITQQDLADALGVSRRTAITLMQELRDAGRITYVAMRDNAGLVVSFGGVINESNGTSNSGHNNGVNSERELGATSAQPFVGGVINETPTDRIPDAETADELDFMGADEADGGVINENSSMDVLNRPNAENQHGRSSETSAEGDSAIYVYISKPVSLSSDTITPPNSRLSLDTAISQAFDELPRDRVNEATGILTKWLVTDRRVVGWVQENYPGRWPAKAIAYRTEQARKRRKNATFDDLKGLKREALEKRAASVRKRIEYAEKRAATDAMPEIREFYKGLASRLEGQRALLAWELGRRDGLDAARIEQNGYSEGEQREFLDLVERERRDTPERQPPRSPTTPVSLPPPSETAASLIASLQARKANGG